ncbi:IclR family transcriptional regulator [Kocuria sp.]|uniref:IclR family transcriptional regulator n=1 Tax=Kocuria sp. TaxID=1871328 RepID=UPI0026DEB9FB|nr:IclR family transcriptional regulator [Kocuria sp.]MDO5618123.1 IclR family transcriptional regulator [Kocuria sp.]
MGQTSGTIHKGLAALSLLGEHPHGATAGEVAQESGLPFSTAYRLLNTLVEAEYVELDAVTKRYHLGLRVFELGQRVASARGYDAVALAVLRTVTERTGESALLAVLDGDHFLTVHTVDGPQYRTTTDPGDRGPLHTSALGRALLAFAPQAQREKLLNSLDLTPRTPGSLVDRERLREEVAQARTRGWASQWEEHDVGMGAVAVPVVTAGGCLLGAVALAAPMFRCERADLEGQVPVLKEAAARLAAQLPLR